MIELNEEDIGIKYSSLGKVNSFLLMCASFSILKPLELFSRLLLHLELPKDCYSKKIRIPHPYNIIINARSKLGKNLTIYHNTTIGSKQWGNNCGAPEIGDNVIIYPNAVIIGNITIGENSIIGAGSIVTRSVEPNSIVAGNPAKKVGSVIMTKGGQK